MLQAEPGHADPPRHPPRDEHFRAIYRAEFEFVWAVARRFGVPPAAQEDAVQEVFLTAYRRLDGLRYEVSPRAWLFTLTRRVASRYHRGVARRTRRVAALAEVSQHLAAVPHARHDAAMQLSQLLAQLSEGTRSVWELTELHGMSGPEIAAELALPLNTVYSRLRLARAQLAALSSETVAAGITATRDRDLPPQDAARRSWAAMVPLMGPTSAATTATAWAAAHPALATTLIAATTATTLAIVTLTPSPPPPPPPALPTITTASPTPPIDITSTPLAAPPPVTSVPRTDPAPSPPRDDLAAEVALLDRIRDHLDVADTTAALAAIDRHTRDFPSGALQDAREAARVEALCLRGDVTAATSAASTLFNNYTDSLIARRYEHYVCAHHRSSDN